MHEEWKSSQIIFKGTVFSLRTGIVSLENDATATREVIEHPGGVVVIPILDNKKIIFIKQFRIALGKELLELPGGRVQDQESIEERALSELEEETGYKANTISHALSYYPVPGITNLKIHIYTASNLVFSQRNLEWDEKVEVVTLSIEEVKKKLAHGYIEDGSAIIGLNHYLSTLN